MRVLHLFSNYKWTGPAEPAVTLVAGLRALGADAVLRCSGYTKADLRNPVVEQAQLRGVDPVADLHLSKHRRPWRDGADVRRLRRILADEGFDLVHCHLANDTRIALRALRGRPEPLVRTLYASEPERVDSSELAGLRQARRIFVFSERMREWLAHKGVAPERVIGIEASVDLERFSPGDRAPGRKALGFGDDDFVVGLVARVQPQRRFDLLLDLAEATAARCPTFRLVVIGRGSRLEDTALEPARRRGLLDESVFFPGYLQGEAYVDALRALDAKLFLVPGTDGTARAVREALACGVPVLSTKRGLLPELVRDGVTGRVLDETPDAFRDALLALAHDVEARRQMGEAARADARERFDPAAQARAVEQGYAALLGAEARG